MNSELNVLRKEVDKTFIRVDCNLQKSVKYLKNSNIEFTKELIAMFNILEEETVSNEARLNNTVTDSYRDYLMNATSNNERDRIYGIKKIEKVRDFLFKNGPYILNKDALPDNKIFKEYYVKFKVSDIYYVDKTPNYCERISYFGEYKRGDCYELKYSDLAKKLGKEVPNENSCYVLLPKGFNILQGVIGEKEFKDLFDKNGTYTVESLKDNEYEKCGDFKVYKNGAPTNIYIDVKNYSNPYERYVKDLVNKKLNNIKAVNAEGRIIIINCNADKKYMDMEHDDLLIISDFKINNLINELALNKIISFIEK